MYQVSQGLFCPKHIHSLNRDKKGVVIRAVRRVFGTPTGCLFWQAMSQCQLLTASSHLSKQAQLARSSRSCQTAERSPQKCLCLSGGLSAWCGPRQLCPLSGQGTEWNKPTPAHSSVHLPCEQLGQLVAQSASGRSRRTAYFHCLTTPRESFF